MKLVITGGGGFVWRNLVRVMIKNNFNPETIVVIDKNKI